jgi:hypothetical protein
MVACELDISVAEGRFRQEAAPPGELFERHLVDRLLDLVDDDPGQLGPLLAIQSLT